MKYFTTLLQQKRLIFFTIILIPMGLYTKQYSGIASNWVHNYFGGIMYVVFFSLLFSIIFNKTNILKIVVLVFIITTIIEILQLWHPQFLESIRASFLGKALIGSTFSYFDIVHYFIGMILSYWIIKRLRF